MRVLRGRELGCSADDSGTFSRTGAVDVIMSMLDSQLIAALATLISRTFEVAPQWGFHVKIGLPVLFYLAEFLTMRLRSRRWTLVRGALHSTRWLKTLYLGPESPGRLDGLWLLWTISWMIVPGYSETQSIVAVIRAVSVHMLLVRSGIRSEQIVSSTSKLWAPPWGILG